MVPVLNHSAVLYLFQFDFFGSAPRRSGVKKEDKKDTGGYC